ncbi:response regulator [Lentimicrobium sp. S6]|uniref:glycoside hydrolase family 130 protein n=1 Tax=Lentimicrobium sp. S6 TaxID=2735872 RepID=UPI0015524785|nr:response regulator [Lentimicrobium sp. S6]NPD45779.1 response regulator [Lentimicrobium sp. S6]
MSINVQRLETKIKPDPKRVITKFSFPKSKERAKILIKRVLGLNENEASITLQQTLRLFSNRHINISNIFKANYNHILPLIEELGISNDALPESKQLLIGAYFTKEQSIESKSICNPSMVEAPDQTDLLRGQKRVVISLRGVGEDGISNLIFREGILNKDGSLELEEMGRVVALPERISSKTYEKKHFLDSVKKSEAFSDHENYIEAILPKEFDYNHLTQIIDDAKLESRDSDERLQALDFLFSLAEINYETTFSLDTTLSERVLFPNTASESQGIEDARFVKYTNNAGVVSYIATYNANDGEEVLPHMIETYDFYHFTMMPLHGIGAHQKGMALFPRKIKGDYVMISRLDGINNYILFSDDINKWEESHLLHEPKFAWESNQVGNVGSPIETEKGWLLLTYGVGVMRQYVIGAVLLDLENPRKVIARLKEPLLKANSVEREGGVPNVVYSCGAMVNDDKLIIPYGVSDTSSAFAYVYLQDIWDLMIPEHGVDYDSQSAHILLVEDDKINQKVVTAVLETKNIRVTVASDGVNALMELAQGNIDVVLSDINMPNFDGFQLLKYMTEKKIDVPVIFLTGLQDASLELKSLQMGAVDYIRKPVDRELLLLKLEKIIGF